MSDNITEKDIRSLPPGKRERAMKLLQRQRLKRMAEREAAKERLKKKPAVSIRGRDIFGRKGNFWKGSNE